MRNDTRAKKTRIPPQPRAITGTRRRRLLFPYGRRRGKTMAVTVVE